MNYKSDQAGEVLHFVPIIGPLKPVCMPGIFLCRLKAASLHSYELWDTQKCIMMHLCVFSFSGNCKFWQFLVNMSRVEPGFRACGEFLHSYKGSYVNFVIAEIVAVKIVFYHLVTNNTLGCTEMAI